MLGFGVPTIAAINGPCFAAGFMFAMGCDYRFMAIGKTFVSMPEVLLRLPLPEGGVAVLRGKLEDHVVSELVLKGKAYQG